MRRSTGNGPIARLIRFQAGFEHRFEALRERYRGVLGAAIASPRRFIAIFLLLCIGSLALVPFAGRDFFPAVDTGEIRLHLRAPTGTRIEDTARITDQVEARVRSVIPKQELAADARQHRRAGERHQPDLRLIGPDRPRRRRRDDHARAETQADRRNTWRRCAPR